MMDIVITLPTRGICAECKRNKPIKTDGMVARHMNSVDWLNTPPCLGSGCVPEHYLYELRVTPAERQIILDALDYYGCASTGPHADTAQMIAASLDPRRRHATEDDQE